MIDIRDKQQFVQDRIKYLEIFLKIRSLDDLDQCRHIKTVQFFCYNGTIHSGRWIRGSGGRRNRQVWPEKINTLQQCIPTLLTHIIQQRHQALWIVLLPVKQVFEVIRQLQDCPHQQFIGILFIVDLPIFYGRGKELHLSGKQSGSSKLDHLQGAEYLMDKGDA